MTKNPILDLPLSQVLRPEIALVLGRAHGVFTVGGFLRAWRSPKKCQQLMSAFDTPAQARHAAATCATWLGVRSPALHTAPATWWATDTATRASA
jgi:hypothetical protein